MATAERRPQGWQVAAPRLVPSASEFRDCWLLSGRRTPPNSTFQSVFRWRSAGCGFAATCRRRWLIWQRQMKVCVADNADDISLTRPFYPRTYPKGRRQADLLGALGLKTMDELLRACDRKLRQHAACSIFWTLGGNQVGKAAIDKLKTGHSTRPYSSQSALVAFRRPA